MEKTGKHHFSDLMTSALVLIAIGLILLVLIESL